MRAPARAPAARRHGRLAAEVRHDVLAEALRLLEVRVAGEDERVDARVHVLADARGNVLAGADEREADAEARAADAGPEVRAQPLALLAQHALALLALGVGAAHVLLHHAFEVVGHVGDHRLGGRARLLFGLARRTTSRRMPKRSVRPSFAARSRMSAMRSRTIGIGLAPEQIDVGLLRADLLRRVGRAAEVPRRARLLVRLREDVALLDLVVARPRGSTSAAPSTPA